MEIRHLRYFIAVAEEGSVTRAAARLGIQQPPLSQQLKALERELGLELLRRHPRGVEPTAAGAALLAEARAMIAHLESATERTRRIARGLEGALTLGLATSAASHRAAPGILATFRERHPAVEVAFIEGNAAALTEAVMQGQADVALIRQPVDRPPELRFLTLLKEPLLVALPKSHALAAAARRRRPPAVDLKALRDESFILVRRSGAPGIYADLVLACRKAGFEPKIAAEVGNMFLNTMLVAAGVGISVVPASMSQSHASLVDYVALRGPDRYVAPLTLVTREDSANPAVKSFAAVARDVASRG